jgi:D-hydroxyproline dehydrogenase subunit beta
MIVTKFPQSCLVVVKSAGGRLLIDPGSFAIDAHDVADFGPVDAVLYTHRHPDHCDERGLEALKRRVAQETPELDRFGIHVMAAQNGLGEVILGDSHEYGENPSRFDSAYIVGLILRELKGFLDLPDWTIQQRWHGIYPKMRDGVQFVHQPEENVLITIASGGCGMTMSFGLAEQHWATLDASVPTTVPSEASEAVIA